MERVPFIEPMKINSHTFVLCGCSVVVVLILAKIIHS